MEYKRYPTYKSSGVEWLEEVPKHWRIERNKTLFSIQKTLVGTRSKDYELLSLTLSGIIPRDVESGKGKFPADFDTYQAVQCDDLVFCLFDMDETPRTIGISRYEGMVTGAYTVVRCNDHAIPLFVYYYYLSVDLFKKLRPYYTGLRKVVRPDTFLNIRLPVPPEDEQCLIARFLDRETTRIDTLIEKKQRLIELLKEKRQAVITQAVTKGLDPNVPMKDSGVEWLGEVPEHWEVTRIKYLVEFFEQGWSPQCENRPAEEDEYGVMKVGCVNGGSFSPGENKALPVELEPRSQYGLMAGDFLMSRANTKELVGSSAVVDRDWPKLLLCDKLYRIRFKNGINPIYIRNYMMSHPIREQIELSASGASDSMQNIGQRVVLELAIPMPPPTESAVLVQYLAEVLEHIKTVETKTDESIRLLREHRSALITAAVTGQIDVRNVA